MFNRRNNLLAVRTNLGRANQLLIGLLGPLLGRLAHFWAVWVTFGPFGSLLGRLGHFWAVWVTFGPFGQLMGRLAHLWAAWNEFGCSTGKSFFRLSRLYCFLTSPSTTRTRASGGCSSTSSPCSSSPSSSTCPRFVGIIGKNGQRQTIEILF
jgi:hypothetical protein